MDKLKAEIAGKRKAAESDPANVARPSKYMRRGDLEKLKEQQERLEREAKAKQAVDDTPPSVDTVRS